MTTPDDSTPDDEVVEKTETHQVVERKVGGRSDDDPDRNDPDD